MTVVTEPAVILKMSTPSPALIVATVPPVILNVSIVALPVSVVILPPVVALKVAPAAFATRIGKSVKVYVPVFTVPSFTPVIEYCVPPASLSVPSSPVKSTMFLKLLRSPPATEPVTPAVAPTVTV